MFISPGERTKQMLPISRARDGVGIPGCVVPNFAEPREAELICQFVTNQPDVDLLQNSEYDPAERTVYNPEEYRQNQPDQPQPGRISNPQMQPFAPPNNPMGAMRIGTFDNNNWGRMDVENQDSTSVLQGGSKGKGKKGKKDFKGKDFKGDHKGFDKGKDKGFDKGFGKREHS